MKIERLEVEGGFLDGLDLPFSDGLNVLIGSRGAGKTSVLEVIRFVLGVPAMTKDAEVAAHQQALAILGDGTATLYCSVQGESVIFSRTGLDDAPSASAAYTFDPPLIVSQNEIEAIGLEPSSRREILDRLIDPLEWAEVDADDSRGAIASLERRIELLVDERDEFAERLERLDEVNESLKTAEKDQKAAAKDEKRLKVLQEQVAKLADEVGQVRAMSDSYKLAEEALRDWRKVIGETEIDRPLPELPSAAIESQVTRRLGKVEEHLSKAADELDAVKQIVAEARAESRKKQTKLQGKLKAETEKLEELQEGAGEAGRRVSALRQELKSLQGSTRRVQQLDKEIKKLTLERDAALDQSEQNAELRYRLRKGCAEALTDRFEGRIEVRVEKSGEVSRYEQALTDSLQGSNLRYKTLAMKLASQLSPRELARSVEQSDSEQIAQVAGISEDRAVRLVAYLQEQSLAPILLSPLDDAVDFALLDGQKYKVTRQLSMGQRCTVVLPILLAEDRRAILLDQPEDHLDNAFIVETLVTAVRVRAESDQVIVATHNANIPVLGDANQVVVLASDGRQGFVKSRSDLDADESVTAITTLMEGGREAFERRAAFYSAHQNE